MTTKDTSKTKKKTTQTETAVATTTATTDQQATANTTTVATEPPPPPLQITVEDVFTKMIPHNLASTEKVRKFDQGKNASVFQFYVCQGMNKKDPNPQPWIVDLNNDKCTVSRGVHATPNCTISINEHHLVSMFWGLKERFLHPDGTILKHQNPQMAFLAGRMRVEQGSDVGMAMKMHYLVNDKP